MPGRSLISLTSMIFCFLRASFFFFCSSYLYLPKSRILQTGGSAFGAISTRSRPALAAISSASLRPTTPTIWPRWSTRRTRMTPISPLIRGPSRVGVTFKGGLAMYDLLLTVDRTSQRRQGNPLRRRHRCFRFQSSNGFAARKGLLLLATKPSRRNRPVHRLSPPDNQHDRHFREAVLAHLVADLLVAGVELDPEPGRRTFQGDLCRILRGLGSDRRDNHLKRRQPQRKTSGIMLDQYGDKPFHRAENRPVNHHRGMAPAILADIDGPEPSRHIEIELDRAALPLAAERVAKVELEFRPVKRALSGVERIGEAGRLDRRFQIMLGPVPDRIAADPYGRPVSEFDLDILEAEVSVDRQQQLAAGDRFSGDLVFRAEDMCVVLDEATDPHQPMQRARRLVPVAAAEFRQPQWKLAVAPETVAEDQHMARAVHRLDREHPIVAAFSDEHVLPEVLPVSRGLPQAAIEEQRPAHFLIAGRVESSAHVSFYCSVERPALRVPEDAAHRLFAQMEQVELAPQPPVVAPLRLFEPVQVLV